MQRRENGQPNMRCSGSDIGELDKNSVSCQEQIYLITKQSESLTLA